MRTGVATLQGSLSSRLIIFGGNGFVGSRVCQAALECGLEVVSVNRSGKPGNVKGGWVQQVEWCKVGCCHS